MLKFDKLIVYSFIMEYNTTIANNDVFSHSKIENLQLIASQYREMIQKSIAILANKNGPNGVGAPIEFDEK